MRTKSIVRTLFTTAVAAGLLQASAAGYQQATPPPVAGQGASANPAAAATPPARPADQTAYTAAVAMTDPEKKLEALQKFVADFPKSGGVAQAEPQILDLLVTNHPDRLDQITPLVDKQIAAISPGSSADLRISQIGTLANKLLDKGLLLDRVDALLGANVDTILSDQVKEQERARTTMRARALELQGRLHFAKGDMARAERELREALAANPSLVPAALTMAQLSVKRGNDRDAITYYARATALSPANKLKADDDAAFRASYKKVNGSDAGFEEAIDKAYKAANPVANIEPYKKTPARTNRLVLAEMFTGSGCGPCVSADLALDAVLQRYPIDAVVALAYHEHIPLPDPMVVAGGRPRFAFYAGTGVPTFEIDGGVVGRGGGARENAPNNYREYVTAIDKALETASRAAVSARATADGSSVKVSAKVSNVDPSAKDVRLQIVLAEQELRFVGENNIRLHTMVVRSIAGENQTGFAVNATGETTVEATFDLAAIKADVTKQIADEIVRVRALPGAAPGRVYNENRAMVDIDLSKLSVVAFVQDGAKNVLQTVRVDLKPTK